MKLQLTVEVLAVNTLSPSDLKRFPEISDTLSKMPASEGLKKSILIVDTFPPCLIDNKAVTRYFPMIIPRTFQDAVALLNGSNDLTMSCRGMTIGWSRKESSFMDQDGDLWCPSPADVLSTKEEWYVNSKAKPYQEKAEFPNV